jgi:hypothetical protein
MKKIFTALVLFSMKMVLAQTAAINTGILYITNSADILYAGSDFTNNSGSALTNNGQLYIKGNLSNAQASIAVGTGTLFLNGASAQSVNGSQPFKTWHLNTNNSSGITLNNDLSVSGTHTFTAGMINTSVTPNYLIYEAGSSYGGDADTRHVNGWVKKFGSTNFVFPVGNATVERAINLISLSGASEFNVKYAPTTPNSTFIQSPMQVINTAEYWIVTKISGGSASLNMNWDNSKVPFPNWVLTDIRVAYYNGSNWIEEGGSAAGNVTTTGTITSNSVAAFGNFTFGSRNLPLPLRIISFAAQRFNNSTQINWITTNEENVNHFEVQRSDDGINFYTITQVAARNRSIIENYSANDKAVIHGIAYYRLNCIDNDGRSKYSQVVSIKENSLNKELRLVINPVHEQIILSAGGQLNGLFHYNVSSANGQLVTQGKLSIQNGGLYIISLPANISPGVYTLQVNDQNTKFNYRVLVQ